MPKRNRPYKQSRLADYLIIKSVIDILLVVTLALAFYLTAFHPYFRGWVDDANSRWVRGWVINRIAPTGDVEAQLYIDGLFVESQAANQPRPDIVSSSLAQNEKHGFFFTTPPLEEGEHEARVYAAHASGDGARRTLQLIGKPYRFVTEANPADPYFRGWVDETNARYIKGWIIDSATPASTPEVQLYLDKRLVESRTANHPRPDLVAAKLAEDGNHGFFFTLPALEAGEHEARVYVVQEGTGGSRRSILRLIGKPVRFVVEAAGNRPSAPRGETVPNSPR